MSRKRKYSESFIQFGMVKYVCKDESERAQCVICDKVMAEESMKPAKLRAHLLSQHQDYKDYTEEMFRKKAKLFSEKGTLRSHGFKAKCKSSLRASYLVALLLAQRKKPHTDGEFVKKCAVIVVKEMLTDEDAKKIDRICLSDDSVKSRIDDMSIDVEEQVVDEIRKSLHPFSLQLDESTDEANCSQLLVFVRYVHGFTVKEEFLFCSPLQTTTKSEDIFKVVDDYFCNHNLDWGHLGSVCTDGAPVMLGKNSGFTTLVKQKSPDAIVTHCMLHRHALASKTLPANLKSVMDAVISAVNFIRSHALKSRLFKQLCEEMGAEYTHLLYHTDVRWLSRGQMLKRVLSLHEQITILLREHRHALANIFSEPIFTMKLAYISDIFQHLNALNVKLQGSRVTIVKASKYVNALKKNLKDWCRRVSRNSFSAFDGLDAFLRKDDNARLMTDEAKDEIKKHLKTLSKNLNGHFPRLSVERWISHPFSNSVNSIISDDKLKNDLIELREMSDLRMLYSKSNILEFWATSIEEYPNLATEALRVALPFVTTYCCEAGFSTLVSMKTKYRTRLDASHDMRLALSATVPRINRLVEKRQEHPSKSREV